MPTQRKDKPSASVERLRREDWVAAATSKLQEKGDDSVRVEVLATQLGVTKGSFYSHFRSRAELMTAVLAGWERKATWNVIDRLEGSGKSPAEKMATLFAMATRRSPDQPGGPLDLAIRAWSAKDKAVREAVEAVDEARRTYIAGLVGQMGLEPTEAQALAFLYYAYISGRNLLQHSAIAQVEHRFQSAERMLVVEDSGDVRVQSWLELARFVFKAQSCKLKTSPSSSRMKS